jgi:hypothetical protein
MSVKDVIQRANKILPGHAAPEGQRDWRWQCIIDLGEYVESDPEDVWSFVAQWGGHPDEDLRSAIATCLLEHLLEHHFHVIFPRVEQRALVDKQFGDMFGICSKFGQAELPENAPRFDALKATVSRGPAA